MWFRFTAPRGFRGGHGFELRPDGDGACVLAHRLEMDLAGLAFLTELRASTPAVLVTGLAITFRALGERRGFRWFAGQAAWAAGVALALGALWWGRNAVVYGWPDIFAQAAHEAAVVGQLRTSELIEQVGPGGYLRQLAATTYHSFFGQFGWMAAPLPASAQLFGSNSTELSAQVQALRQKVDTFDARLRKLEGLIQQNQELLGLLKEVETLKADVAKMRGQGEMQTHQIDTLGKRQNDLYVDLDQRLSELAKAAKPPPAPPPPMQQNAPFSAMGIEPSTTSR